MLGKVAKKQVEKIRCRRQKLGAEGRPGSTVHALLPWKQGMAEPVLRHQG